jgi:GTPase SAR1 family protein
MINILWGLFSLDNQFKKNKKKMILCVQSDLEHKRAVELEEAAAYAQENNILHLETSAKNAKNVKQLFVEIARKLPKNPPETARESFPIIPPKGDL